MYSWFELYKKWHCECKPPTGSWSKRKRLTPVAMGRPEQKVSRNVIQFWVVVLHRSDCRCLDSLIHLQLIVQNLGTAGINLCWENLVLRIKTDEKRVSIKLAVVLFWFILEQSTVLRHHNSLKVNYVRVQILASQRDTNIGPAHNDYKAHSVDVSPASMEVPAEEIKNRSLCPNEVATVKVVFKIRDATYEPEALERCQNLLLPYFTHSTDEALGSSSKPERNYVSAVFDESTIWEIYERLPGTPKGLENSK